MALDNAGIDPDVRLCATHNATVPEGEHNQLQGPALAEANDEEIVYEITFNLPNAGPPVDDEGAELADSRDDTVNTPVIPKDNTANAGGQKYPSRACRSVDGNQPYNTYAPRTSFLQLGMAQALKSVLEASRLQCMTKEEQMMATTSTTNLLKGTIDNAVHRNDPEMTTMSKDEIKVWAYLMTQYNLKPGLTKFGKHGKTAAIKELMQLHVMDMWTAMDPTKLSREQRMKALSLLLFSKGKENGGCEGMRLYKRSTTASIHSKGRGGLANGVHRINIYHGIHRSKGKMDITML